MGEVRARDPLWSVPFSLTIVTGFLLSMVFISLVTSISVIAIERFQADGPMAGLVAGAFVLGAVVSRLLLGGAIDHIGRRRMMIIALAAYLLASVAYFAVAGLPMLVALRLIHGAAFGIAQTTVTTSAMALIPDSRRSEGTGYFGMTPALTAGLGPLLGITLITAYGPEGLFTLASVCALGALVVALFVRPPESTLKGTRRPRGLRLSQMVEPSAVGISSVVLTIGAAYSGVMAFLSAYTISRGTPELASIFFLVYAATVVVGRFFIGRLQDRFGDNAVMYPMLAGFVAALLMLAFAQSTAWFLVAAVVLGLGYGGLSPCLQAIVVRVSPRERLALAVSTFFTIFDIGIGFGPVVLGAILSASGFSEMYVACAVIGGFSAVVYFLVHGRRQRGTAAGAAEPASA